MDKDLRCLRCGGEMEYLYTEHIQLGKSGAFLGQLSNLIAGALLADIYRCRECGKLEFFDGEHTEAETEVPQIVCPVCGKQYDADAPWCPLCKHRHNE